MSNILAGLCIASVIYCGALNNPEWQERDFVEPQIIRATVYTAYGNAKTADGSIPHHGVIAGRKEDIGKSAILYEVEADGSIGDLIGYFEFKDTGGHEGLKNGTRIDIYRDSLDECWEWVAEYGDYVYIQVIDAVG